MSSSKLDTKLELQLPSHSTSHKSTGTDLTMLDIRHLEDLQLEIRQLRQEVALLEDKLQQKNNGDLQLQKNHGGAQELEDVSSLRKRPRTCKNRAVQAMQDGCSFKNEPSEMSYCKALKPTLQRFEEPSVESNQCYTDQRFTEAQDFACGDKDSLQEMEDESGLFLHYYNNPNPEDTQNFNQNILQDVKVQSSLIKTESVSPDCEDDVVKMVDSKNNLELNGNIKEEEEHNGYHEEHLISSNMAMQSCLEDSIGPSVSEENISSVETCLRRQMGLHFESFDAAKEQSYSCFWCGKKFLSAPVLRVHLSTHECTAESSECSQTPAHPRSHISEDIVRDKRYPCIHCGQTFSDLSHCKTHEKTHAGEGPYQCSQCGSSFRFLDSFQNHQKEHARERGTTTMKPYQCTFCNKQFATKATLIVHRRIHTGERPYQCCFCDQAFTRSDRLKEHERIHTGEKPYQCNSCGKQFSQAASLRTHQRIHTGEKPYQCSSCEKQFSDLTGLRTHERQHTGEKPYRCLQCGKTFAQASNLRAHRRTHEAEQSLMFSI